MSSGCGGDDGPRDPTVGESGATGSSSPTTSSSGTSSGESSESSSDGGSSSGEAPQPDPVYPPQVDGACVSGFPIAFGDATLCAPACVDGGDPCPAPDSGSSTASCIPFNDGEDAAFWACLLSCASGQTCPDAMACAAPISACGYL